MRYRRTLGCALLLALFAIEAPTAANGSDLDAGLDSLAASIAKGLKERDVRRLAVVEFTDIRGYSSALDPFLAEELTTRLFRLDPSFNIVERRQLQRVLEEQKLTSSALFDESTIAAVGKALGIQAIVTGSISDLGSEVRVNARAIAVDTAQVFAAAAASLPMTGSVEYLVRQSAAPTRQERSTTGSSSPVQVQPSNAFYQNAFLRASVASVSRNVGSVRIALILENLTSETISLAYEAGDDNASLVDSGGSDFYLSELSGIREWHSWNCGDDVCTELNARERTTVTLEFNTRFARRGASQDEGPRAPLSVSVELLKVGYPRKVGYRPGVWQDDRPRRQASSFTVGINNIRF